jgi:hypothetical protein
MYIKLRITEHIQHMSGIRNANILVGKLQGKRPFGDCIPMGG